MTMASSIHLSALGPPKILTPCGPLNPAAEYVFATALYLILSRKAPTGRRQIAELLWPKVPASKASHRLRQTFLRLRKLGFSLQDDDRQRVRLKPGTASADFEIAAADRPEELLQLPMLAPLLDYEPVFSAEYSAWIDRQRQSIVATVVPFLLSALQKRRVSADWAGLESVATRLLQLDPLNEEATIALAESLALRGAKQGSVRILEQYLAELGRGAGELRVQASVMRKRITEALPGSSPTFTSVPFVGRAEPMEAMTSVLARVSDGFGRTFHVSGDAGIGKTRLVAELTAFASLQGYSIARTSCRPSDSNRPLSAFVDLVPMLRAMRGAIGCSPETLRYLDRITLLREDADAPSGPAGEADFVYARVQRALVDLIDAISYETPLLVVIEDVPRLDKVSINLLADLVAWAESKRILFAFTSREARPNWLSSTTTSVLEVQLGPLADEHAVKVVSATAERLGARLTAEDLDWCLLVAEGNPYFLAEIANHLIETGGRHAAPPSLSAVISDRLGRLDTPTLQLLQTSALLANNCSIERLERILEYPHHRLLQSVNELGQSGMLVFEPSHGPTDPIGRLIPRHDLLATAAENLLSGPAKAFLHQRIGTVLETEISDNRSASILWDCAEHWQAAGNSSRAFSLAKSCAVHLMTLGLCSAAAEAYTRSLAYCGSDAERLEMLKGAASALYGASEWSSLAETCQRVNNLTRYLHPDDDGHDEVELMNVRALWQVGDLLGARDRALACLECSTATPSHRVRSGIMALMLLYLGCNDNEMQATYSLLVPLFDNPSVDEASKLEAKMVYHSSCGDPRLAVDAAGSLIQKRLEADSVADLVRAYTNGAAAARTAGEVELAKSWLADAIGIAESHRLPLATTVPMQMLASIALDDNDIERASYWHQRLSALPRPTKDAVSVLDSIGLRIALSRRDVREAARLATGELKNLQQDPNPHRRTYGLALVAAVTLAEGKLPNHDFMEDFERAYTVARNNARQAFATCVLVAALRRAGFGERAQGFLDEYRTTYRREPTPAPLHTLELLTSFQEEMVS